MSTRPTVSVVIPFLGDRAAGDRLLEGLRRLDLGRGDEVIVADNTPDAIFPESPGGPVRVVRAAAERSPFHARNAGAGAARGDWLLFTDADCRPSPNLIGAYLKRLQGRCGVLAGAVVPLAGQAGLIARYARSRNQLSEGYHAVARPQWPHPAGITGNLMVRREAWEQVGGFCEGILAGADIELCWRVQDAGWGFLHVPEARVEHAHVESLGALLRQANVHAAGMRWVNRRHPGSFPRPPLVRELARCAVGIVAWALRGQGQRSLFKLLDGAWWLAYARGHVTGNNRAPRAVAASPEAAEAVLLAYGFPSTPAGAPERRVAQLNQGLTLRVEALMRPAVLDRDLLARAAVVYAEDDPPPARLRATLVLAVRHPVRCLRHLAARRSGDRLPRIRVLAAPLRRCARSRGPVILADADLARSPVVRRSDGEHPVSD